MERPLPAPTRRRNALQALAHALLSAEASVQAHEEVLRAALVTARQAKTIHTLAERTLAWTSARPEPRIHVLAHKLRNDPQLQRLLQRHRLQPAVLSPAPRMRNWPGLESLPRIATIGELAAWLHLDVPMLLWMADLQDRNRHAPNAALAHYHPRLLPKRDGSFRLVEAPKQHLRHVQRQILHSLLVHVSPHEAAHGFRRGRSTLTFVDPHVGQAVVLRMDLRDFFASISGPRVQALFRTLGYPEPVADLLGGLCTTTTPELFWNDLQRPMPSEAAKQQSPFYRRPHLPQGAPTSPSIANLCALRFDRRLAALAAAEGATYTRYADDLAFSWQASSARRASGFALHVAAILQEEGFAAHHRKTRIMGTSSRQHMAGLTTNVRPNLQRKELDCLKATLTNCLRHGPELQNRAGHPDFRRHLEGRLSYLAMVHPQRATKLKALFDRISWPNA